MGKTSPHINRYIVVEDKNECNTIRFFHDKEKCTRYRMSETHASTQDHYEPGIYEIRIKGHLDDKWAAEFEGLTITLVEDGDTLLTGPVIDQAALHGLLKKVRDLGLPLVSVSPVEPGPSTTLGAGQADA
jgi:hypothetical protein